MTSSLLSEAILSSFNWSEKSGAGQGHEVGYLRWLSALAPISSAELSLAFPNIRTRARSLARGRDLVYGDVIAAAVIEDPENSKNLHSDFLRSLDRGH
jgi:hypothetical protein